MEIFIQLRTRKKAFVKAVFGNKSVVQNERHFLTKKIRFEKELREMF